MEGGTIIEDSKIAALEFQKAGIDINAIESIN